MRRACGEDLHIQKVYTPGMTYGDRQTGTSAHTDMVIAPLDIDKVLVYPAGLDVDTCAWLWANGYTLIEAWTGATVAAGKHVSDEVVYKMVKAVAENLDRVHAIHSAFQKYSKDTMLAKPKAMDYHPGAAKYYRERGWLK